MGPKSQKPNAALSGKFGSGALYDIHVLCSEKRFEVYMCFTVLLHWSLTVFKMHSVTSLSISLYAVCTCFKSQITNDDSFDSWTVYVETVAILLTHTLISWHWMTQRMGLQWNLGIRDTQGTGEKCLKFWGGLISQVHFHVLNTATNWSSCP